MEEEKKSEGLTHNTFVLPGDVITQIDQSSNVVIGNGVAQRLVFLFVCFCLFFFVCFCFCFFVFLFLFLFLCFYFAFFVHFLPLFLQ